MPSTLEMVDKETGMLPAVEVIDSIITGIAVQIGTYATTIPEERIHEKALFQEIRNNLFELRGYLNRHFEYKK